MGLYNTSSVYNGGHGVYRSGIYKDSSKELSYVIGGRRYKCVKIGGKIWMAENLDYKYSGLVVGQSGSSSSEPRANYYDNSESQHGVYGDQYGLLYNWAAVDYLESNKDGLIPGWHVPSRDEWTALVEAVGGASTAGTALKSTTGWSSGNGDDNYGLSVFPAGYNNAGTFSGIGSTSIFWTATDAGSTFAMRVLFNTSASVSISGNYKTLGYSLRLVKD